MATNVFTGRLRIETPDFYRLSTDLPTKSHSNNIKCTDRIIVDLEVLLVRVSIVSGISGLAHSI